LGVVRHIAALLFIIALPVALLTTNIRIAVNEPRVYEYAIDQYGAVDVTGIPRDELHRASGELRDFFNSDDDDLVVSVRNSEGELVALFNARERAHLQDVRNVFQGVFRVQEASVLFVLAYVVGVFIWAREGTLRTLATQVLLSGLLSIAVIGVVGGIALAGFDESFTRFHEVLFDNDLWQLDPDTDHLIQMFPEEFWQRVSLWVGLATLAELAALSLVSVVYLALNRRTPSEPVVLASGPIEPGPAAEVRAQEFVAGPEVPA
jgi:integral membrane protein (TIGR01906 family)